MTTDLGSFMNWLGSSQGWIIYVVGFFTIVTYLVLFSNLENLRRTSRLRGLAIWLGGGVLPVILVTLVVPYGALFCAPPLAIPLLLGLFILAFQGPKFDNAREEVADEVSNKEGSSRRNEAENERK